MNNTATKRKVKIVTERGTHFVRYVDRKKFGRYSVAQFDARHSTKEYVETWVKAQPNLALQSEG